MPIHRKIIIIAGLGMLAVMTIVVLSLVNVISAFSSIIGEVERSSQEVRQIEEIAKEVAAMSHRLHRYVTAGDPGYRSAYETSLAAVRGMFGEFEQMNLRARSLQLNVSLRADVARFDEKAGRIFALKDVAGRDRVLAQNLLIETDGLLEWMNRDIEKYSKEAQALQIRSIADDVYFQKKQVVLLFVVFLILSGGFLVFFGVFVHRTIAVPLNDLWKGATEVSQGNLDYRMQLEGTGDLAQLAERFNEMALKLKRSYAELEKKLFERTNELAAIDAVALTLSQAANMKEMLTRSLSKILDSLVGLEPRGGGPQRLRAGAEPVGDPGAGQTDQGGALAGGEGRGHGRRRVPVSRSRRASPRISAWSKQSGAGSAPQSKARASAASSPPRGTPSARPRKTVLMVCLRASRRGSE